MAQLVKMSRPTLLVEIKKKIIWCRTTYGVWFSAVLFKMHLLCQSFPMQWRVELAAYVRNECTTFHTITIWRRIQLFIVKLQFERRRRLKRGHGTSPTLPHPTPPASPAPLPPCWRGPYNGLSVWQHGATPTPTTLQRKGRL